jgi:hypothetical protein
MTDQPYGPDEAREAKRELRNKQAKARPISPKDRIEIRFLDNLTARRARARKFLEDDVDYKRMKDKFLNRIEDTGEAISFITDANHMRYATAYRSTKLQVDEALLEKIMRELGFDEDTISSVLPRKVDAAALRRLVSRHAVLRARLPDFAREIPHVSYVAFSDPITDTEVDDVT